PSSTGTITTSTPSTSARAASRRCSGVSPGQSVPTTSTGPPTAAIAAIIRAPRSPSGCTARATPGSAARVWNTVWGRSGVTHKVTGPVAAAGAVVTTRAMSRAGRRAAPSAPNTGTSRVLARPGSGALARIAMATGSGLPGNITIRSRQSSRICAEKIRQSQPPHEHDSSYHAMLFPPPPRGHDRRGDTKRRPGALEALGHGDVLHQRNVGKARPERRPRREYHLVAGGNTGHPRAQIHRRGNHRE